MIRQMLPAIKVHTVRGFGWNFEVHELIGMAKKGVHQKADATSIPCWLGERSRSAEIEGNKIPIVVTIIKVKMVQISHKPTDIHL